MSRKHRNLPYRSLAALERTASTTRVLNLAQIAVAHGKLPEHSASPLFKSPLLNRAIILKHRLRADDPPLMHSLRGTATKVIIPIDPGDLNSGGASFFVAQNGWLDLLEDLSDGEVSLRRDQAMLECLDLLPSFDPFLMREYLRRRDFHPADCYFAISPSDRAQMRRVVEPEIARLIALAYGNEDAIPGGSGRLVDILLSSDKDARLDPLRQTLRLDGESYRDGMFSWKGFLYYKWALSSLWPKLRDVIVEIGKLEVTGRPNGEIAAFVAGTRARLQRTIQVRCRDIETLLGAYDEAFARLIDNGDAMAFRDFLLKAPALFMELGERVGMISHVASFWRYRFPVGSTFRANEDEVLDLLRDFETGLGQPALYLAA